MANKLPGITQPTKATHFYNGTYYKVDRKKTSSAITTRFGSGISTETSGAGHTATRRLV